MRTKKTRRMMIVMRMKTRHYSAGNRPRRMARRRKRKRKMMKTKTKTKMRKKRRSQQSQRPKLRLVEWSACLRLYPNRCPKTIAHIHTFMF